MLRSEEKSVLMILLWRGPQARKQLLDACGLTRNLLNVVVDSLGAEGWTAEEGQLASTGGRRSGTIGLNKNRGYLVGVDVEPHRAQIQISDFALKSVAAIDLEFDARDGPGLVTAKIAKHVNELIESKKIASETLLGIGISLPGQVEGTTGLLVNPPALPGWEGFDVRDAFLTRLSRNIRSTGR